MRPKLVTACFTRCNELMPTLHSFLPLLLAVPLLADPTPLGPDTTSGDAFLPDQPVGNFSLPRFDSTGRRIWELQGGSAQFTTPDTVQLVDLRIELFSFHRQPSTILRSPRATINLSSKTATGDGFIAVDGPGFTVDGNRWSWDGDTRKIRIADGAIVRISDRIGGFLR